MPEENIEEMDTQELKATWYDLQAVTSRYRSLQNAINEELQSRESQIDLDTDDLNVEDDEEE